MRKISLFILALFTLFSLSVAPQARAELYVLEKPHTQILFNVSHLGFSKSYGKFLKFDGEFHFDPTKVEDSKINVIINTASIEMNDGKWNDHLKNADFFNVEKFPEMTFTSTAIQKTGENTGLVTGNLTLLGVTKPITLNVTYNKTDIHPFTKETVAGFSARGSLKRSDFGMTYGLPGIGDEVEIILEVEGLKRDSTPSN